MFMMFIFPNRKQCIFEPNNRCFEFFVRKDTAFCEAVKERLFTANIPLENAIDKIAKRKLNKTLLKRGHSLIAKILQLTFGRFCRYDFVFSSFKK